LEGKNSDQDNLDLFSPILITVLEDHDLEESLKGVAGLTFCMDKTLIRYACVGPKYKEFSVLR